MAIDVRAFTHKDIPEMITIWNEIVQDGIAFPQTEILDAKSGLVFLMASLLLV